MEITICTTAPPGHGPEASLSWQPGTVLSDAVSREPAGSLIHVQELR